MYYTQTECVLAVQFNLAADCQTVAEQLAAMVNKCGVQLKKALLVRHIYSMF